MLTTFSSPFRRLPSDKKLEVRGRILSHRKKIAFAGASFIGGLVYAYESHIQECPVTGRRRFVALYPDQAKRISQEEFNNLLQAELVMVNYLRDKLLSTL